MTGLTVEKLSMRFELPGGGAVQALQDVSFNLKKGELLSVLGPSGCGKTTLLNIVAGFLSPTSGNLTLNGRVINGPDAQRGMVFQKGALFEWMSVRENVEFGPKMKGMPRAEKDEIVNHLLGVVGLQDIKEKAVYELSGGMQQRVALARCLANDPDVILMDEPLGALDALTREKMQALVLKLWKETGKTIILITHSVEEALLLGERLIVMAPRPGRIHKEYNLPFAELGVDADLREVKKYPDFAVKRDEILNMIWDMGRRNYGQFGERGMIALLVYIAIFVAAYFIVTKGIHRATNKDYSSLKTVTFGDETAVRPNRWASVISVLTIFLMWAVFTGSALVPSFLHAPGPFEGTTSFTYTAEANGQKDDGLVSILVHDRDVKAVAPKVVPGDGFAKDDSAVVAKWRTGLINVLENDSIETAGGAKIVAIDGQPVEAGDKVKIANGTVTLSSRGTPNFEPNRGWQMEPLYLPAPEAVWSRTLRILDGGYRNFTLFEHLGYSLFRVIVGFALGALVGIPLGYAMGLSNWFRGWFDPIVEFMRPVPPLALIPLVIIWAGIGESGKIILLFLAALWIMTIAARAGVSGVNISKVHAAYSLGASKTQIMRYVVVPNSLPEIFTGARVAMGVCWGTVVAAELVAAEQGAGMMIMTASKFQNTDIVIMGIILIGMIGFGIDILMRWAERILVPWKGKG